MSFPDHPVKSRLGCALVGIALLGGCATAKDPRDPFEPVNRAIYGINEGLDKAVLEPTAKLYRFAVPAFVRASVGNVFSNVGEIRNIFNNTLQGNFRTAYSDFGRLAINSTLGVLGLFDVASEAGIEKHQEDFGQTMGKWGIADGPFIMLPLFGPSNVRDTAGWAVDAYTDPFTYVDPSRAQNQIRGARIVQGRSELFDAKKVLDTMLDPYQSVRDGYLQRRRSLIYDGKPPQGKDPMAAPPKQEGAPAKP